MFRSDWFYFSSIGMFDYENFTYPSEKNDVLDFLVVVVEKNQQLFQKISVQKSHSHSPLSAYPFGRSSMQ